MSSFYGNGGGDGEKLPSINIDNTLTKVGQAADAKKTGDEINLLKNGQLTGNSLTFNKGTENEITITAAQLETLLSLASAEGVEF